MTSDEVLAKTQHALQLLDWELRDLFIRTFAYGNAGTEADVREHLRTGNHLTAAQLAVVDSALNDALRDIGSSFRV